VKGFWDETDALPQLFDQDGQQLLVRSAMASDMKTDTGEQFPDKSTFSVDVNGLSALKTIKVVLGPAQDVETWARSVVLQPA